MTAGAYLPDRRRSQPLCLRCPAKERQSELVLLEVVRPHKQRCDGSAPTLAMEEVSLGHGRGISLGISIGVEKIGILPQWFEAIERWFRRTISVHIALVHRYNDFERCTILKCIAVFLPTCRVQYFLAIPGNHLAVAGRTRSRL
jgi:hypothetical protein